MFQLRAQLIEFNYGLVKGVFVFRLNRQFQQARDVFTALFQLIDGFDNGFQRRALFA